MTTRTPAAARGGRSRWHAGALALCAAALSPFVETAGAQVIAVKTTRAAEGEQFGHFPSLNRGMGGVSIALADTLHDPFVNPAKGGRVQGARVFGAPTLFSVSHRAGSGWTVPLGALVRRGSSFAALSLAIQDIDPSNLGESFAFPDLAPGAFSVAFTPPAARVHSQRSRHLFALAGRRLEGRKLSLGGSIAWSEVRAVDGIDLLYTGSQTVRPRGHTADIRVGALKEWEGGSSLEALLLHRRVGVGHDVGFTEMFWDPNLRHHVPIERIEPNDDRSRTWGVHLQYERPLPADGWRLGGIFTGNLISQPSLPNFTILGTPGDAGRAQAYNIGAGISRSRGASTIGVDAILEPIRSRTWTHADAATESASGAAILPGTRVTEHDFRFTNAIVRAGVAHRFALQPGDSARQLGVQLGGQLRSIGYWHDTWSHLEAKGRSEHERWEEVTPTWGVNLRFSRFELLYSGQHTTGTRRPGFEASGGFIAVADARLASSVFWPGAPVGSVPLSDVRVTTHQFSVSLPLR